MKSVFLAGAILISGCSDKVDVKLFNYQGCRKQMTEEYINQGIDPMAADMKSKAYCREQQDK
ncbi:MAG: hypothetical protein ABW104_15815 [Candidatus Thiodiazotropha sp. 6PLUC2]